MSPPTFRSDRRWSFDVGAEELWERIADTGRYADWWPWLHSFDPGPGMVEGAEWACVVSPPLPYVVRFTLHIESVDEGRRIESTVDGDIGGTATLTIDEPADDGELAAGATARLESSLHPRNPLLRGFGVVARPLVEYGHDWVLDQGRRQFVERAWGPG
jgi:hypothetical protein